MKNEEKKFAKTNNLFNYCLFLVLFTKIFISLLTERKKVTKMLIKMFFLSNSNKNYFIL